MPGRKYHGAGELFEYELYSSVVTATRPDGTPLFTEKLVARPWRQPVRQAGAMGKFDVFANLTLVTPQSRGWPCTRRQRRLLLMPSSGRVRPRPGLAGPPRRRLTVAAGDERGDESDQSGAVGVRVVAGV